MTYIVRTGDNLTTIAKEFNTTVSTILTANPKIKNPDVIYAGTDLVIPVNNSENSKDYASIGKQVEKCLNDIEKLDSFQKLSKMLG